MIIMDVQSTTNALGILVIQEEDTLVDASSSSSMGRGNDVDMDMVPLLLLRVAIIMRHHVESCHLPLLLNNITIGIREK